MDAPQILSLPMLNGINDHQSNIELHTKWSNSPITPSEQLAATLKGKKAKVPNMMEAMKGWPVNERHPELERMRRVFDETLDRVIKDPKIRQGFKNCDIALFCALWLPFGEWEDFYAASIFILWIFIWDDKIDMKEHALSDDFEESCRFREQTLGYVRYCLGLHEGSDLEEPAFPSEACGLFKDFSDRILLKFPKGRIETLYNEIVRYVKECEVEQAYRLAGEVPNPDAYLHNRGGTVALGVLCPIQELFLESTLPDWVMESPEMDIIWRETNMGIIIINDLLSFKKEMATGCVLNILPVLYHGGQDWDKIVPELILELEAICNRLDEAAAVLDKATSYDSAINKNLQTFVELCRTCTTATWIYTFTSKRYKIASDVQEDGSLIISL
ncbi:isoprenoid synthase domain-containing protein [Trichoderma velutinum]